VAEGRVAKVMREAMVSARSSFNFNAARCLRAMARLPWCASGACGVVAGAVQEDLRLVFQAGGKRASDDAVAVALVLGAPFGGGSGYFRPREPAAELGVGREISRSSLLEFLARAGHATDVRLFGIQEFADGNSA